jgi:BirA family biotin operon repressor/biotin-[acetyl-CoA-carboxylase] ligase
MSAAPPLSWRIERHERLASTNDRAIEAAEAGSPPGLMVLAAEQTAGRGRSGRAWASPRGNLFASVLLPPLPELRGGAAALLAGLAAHDAAVPFLPEAATLRLKWPNDLLAGGAKLGGILTEAGTSPNGIDWLVAGIGLNIAAAPEAPGRAVTSIAALGGVAGVEEVAERLLAAFAARLGHFAESGMPGIVSAWRERALAEGTAMSVHRGGAPVTGHYAGLADDGALLLATAGGIARIVAGEVFAEV